MKPSGAVREMRRKFLPSSVPNGAAARNEAQYPAVCQLVPLASTPRDTVLVVAALQYATQAAASCGVPVP